MYKIAKAFFWGAGYAGYVYYFFGGILRRGNRALHYFASGNGKKRYTIWILANGGGLIAFSQEIGQGWYDYNYFEKIEKAKNSTSRYDRAVRAFKRNKMQHGIYLDLIFENNIDFLDLKEQRFEVKSSYRR